MDLKADIHEAAAVLERLIAQRAPALAAEASVGLTRLRQIGEAAADAEIAKVVPAKYQAEDEALVDEALQVLADQIQAPIVAKLAQIAALRARLAPPAPAQPSGQGAAPQAAEPAP
jgi:hypothetical protein